MMLFTYTTTEASIVALSSGRKL